MKISGKILDSKEEPLGLANVTIIDGERANKFGAVASIDGTFSLESDLIKPDSTFTISYLGFVSQNFKAKDLIDKTIKLKESIETLKEVVVFAQPKKNTTVQVSNFKAHLEKHKLVYASIGAALGLLLLASSIKK